MTFTGEGIEFNRHIILQNKNEPDKRKHFTPWNVRRSVKLKNEKLSALS